MANRATIFAVNLILICFISGSVASAEGIAVLGLGGMGTAVARCLADNNHSVHAWNRSAPRHKDLSSIILHSSMHAAVGNATSGTVLIVIDSWEGAKEVTLNVAQQVDINGDKLTVVVFSTYTPDEIYDLSISVSDKLNLVGGAIVGVPETICTKAALTLVSSSDLDKELKPLGRLVSTSSANNVGSASLLNIALILTITFGIAGTELAFLMIQASESKEIQVIYSGLAQEFGTSYIGMLLPLVSKSFIENNYSATYVPAETLHSLFLKVCHYIHTKLGIKGETFLDTYVASLGQVVEPGLGPLAWTKYYLSGKQEHTEL